MMIMLLNCSAICEGVANAMGFFNFGAPKLYIKRYVLDSVV